MLVEEAYIGTKIIKAIPMTNVEFAEIRKQPASLQEVPGYQVRYEDGYVSWSPKETFERAYRKISKGEWEILGFK